jgi:hypothetical protein
MHDHRDQADPRIADLRASEQPPQPPGEKRVDLGLTYVQALHGMQSGVAYEMGLPDRGSATSAKHLRVGVNSAMIDTAAIVDLLVAKRVFTREEFMEQQRLVANEEVVRYEHLHPGIKFR